MASDTHCPPVAVVLLQTLCGTAPLNAASAQQTLPAEMAELERAAVKVEVTVGASCLYWLALQAVLRAQCAQLAPARRLVRRSLCMHQHPHQLLAPTWQPTLLSDSTTYPAAEAMLHRVADLFCCALFMRAAVDASRELLMACSGYNNHTCSYAVRCSRSPSRNFGAAAGPWSALPPSRNLARCALSTCAALL